MKKSVLFFLAALLVGFVAVAQDDPPEELSADAPKGTPTIDADISDAAYSDEVAFPGMAANAAEQDGDSDISGSWKAAWDDDNLYVAVKVLDEMLDFGEDDLNDAGDGFAAEQYNYDNVEIFINPTGERNADDVTYATANASQIRYNPTDGTQDYNNSAAGYIADLDGGLDLLEWSSEEISGGYVVEALIPWSAILPDPTTVPEKIGFTVNVGDSDEAGGNREGILLWVGAGSNDNQWNNINYFGILNLTDGGETSINEATVTSLNLYPNPATNMVTVENATEDIVVYNSIGQVVLTVAANSSTINVDVSSLAAGIYVFQSGSSMNKVLVK